MSIFEKRSVSREQKSPTSRKSSIRSISRTKDNQNHQSPLNKPSTSMSHRKRSHESTNQRRSPFRPQSDLIKIETGQEQPQYPHFRNLSDQYQQPMPAHAQVNQTLPVNAVYDGMSFVNTSNGGSTDLRGIRDRYRQIVSSLGHSYADTNNESTLSVN